MKAKTFDIKVCDIVLLAEYLLYNILQLNFTAKRLDFRAYRYIIHEETARVSNTHYFTYIDLANAKKSPSHIVMYWSLISEHSKYTHI